MNKKLKTLADLLLKRNLRKEADGVLLLAESGLTKSALWWQVGVLAAGLFAAFSDDAKDIIGDLTDDFEDEEAGPLFEKWYKKLAGTDLVDGWGSFPEGDPMGGAFMRKFIRAKWNKKSSMTEDEFEEAFEKYYGESASGIVQWGLDNEGGWVDSYNGILKLWKGQDEARKNGLDWRTGEPPLSEKLIEIGEKAGEAMTEKAGEDPKDSKPSKPKDSKETEEPQAKLSPKNLLTLDSRGKAVVRLQKALIAAGFDLPKHGVDGHFGAETKAAVLAFKRKALADGKYEGLSDAKVTPDIIGLIESYNKAVRFNAPEDEGSEASESSKAHRFNAPESEASESSEKKSRFNDP